VRNIGELHESELRTLLTFVYSPHEFVTKGAEKMLTFQIDEVEAEARFFDPDFGIDMHQTISGIKRDIKVFATTTHPETDLFIV
jgi:hypothetical protein